MFLLPLKIGHLHGIINNLRGIVNSQTHSGDTRDLYYILKKMHKPETYITSWKRCI